MGMPPVTSNILPQAPMPLTMGTPFGTPFGSPFAMPGMPGMPGMPFMFAPQPAVVGYRPVIANGPVGGDAFTSKAQPPASPFATETSSASPAADPTAQSADPTAAKTGAAGTAEIDPVTGQPAAKAAATYEEQLGDRVTALLQKNPELSTRVQQWETDLEAKGLNLETMAENPEQLVQEMIANPNSVVSQNINEFKQTTSYKIIHRLYKMVPGPIKKLMIKVLPNKYETMAEQTLDTLFEQPATPTDPASGSGTGKKSASSGPSSSSSPLDEPTSSPSSSSSSSSLDSKLDALAGESGSSSPSSSKKSSSLGDSSIGDIASDLSGGPSDAKGSKEPAL